MYSNILCSKINILNVISHELISRKITFSKFEERMFICLGGRGGDIEREETLPSVVYSHMPVMSGVGLGLISGAVRKNPPR